MRGVEHILTLLCRLFIIIIIVYYFFDTPLSTYTAHAEDVHNAVLADLLSLWVLPNVTDTKEKPGGWKCVHRDEAIITSTKYPNKFTKKLAIPSKAAFMNKMRWALFEQKACRKQQKVMSHSVAPKQRGAEELACTIRNYFPFFREQHQKAGDPLVFLENAGGSQVPLPVLEGINSCLRYRHRSVAGTTWKEQARQTLHALLGASSSLFDIYLGANATSLFTLLATEYVRLGLLQASDEIIISTENHMANITPWVDVAEVVGATVIWFDSSSNDSLSCLEKLLSDKTRIVAIPHASNILGMVRDVAGICQMAQQRTSGGAHVVVDGVAVAPHLFVNVDNLGADWYAISGHKVFGPHIGVLCGRRCSDSPHKFQLELGTVNYEACAGVVGLGLYFIHLESLARSSNHEGDDNTDTLMPPLPPLPQEKVEVAYKLIHDVEAPPFKLLYNFLSNHNKVCIVEAQWPKEGAVGRLPLISFTHREVSSQCIVDACEKAGVACRNGTFLSCSQFQEQYHINPIDGVVRVSLVHYNTPEDAERLEKVLESIPGWF